MAYSTIKPLEACVDATGKPLGDTVAEKPIVRPNAKLQDEVPPFPLKIVTYNVNNSVRDEANPLTRWSNRRERVKRLLLKIDADIICLQELRVLDSTPEAWLSEFEGYRFDIVYCNATKLGFARAILYKIDRFMPIARQSSWLSETPEVPSDFVDSQGKQGFGAVVQAVQFLYASEGKVDPRRAFWVFNTHLGMDELVKTQSCVLLGSIGQRLKTLERPGILAGDFNFFFDMNGREQFHNMLNQWDDLAVGRIASLGRPIEGTFVGYEADTHRSALPVNDIVFGKLDHIFGLGFESHGARVHTETMLEPEPQELTERDSLPSDHLPLSIIVQMSPGWGVCMA